MDFVWLPEPIIPALVIIHLFIFSLVFFAFSIFYSIHSKKYELTYYFFSYYLGILIG